MPSEEIEQFTRMLDEAAAGSEEDETAARTPSPEGMTFRRIVVGVDGSHASLHAVEWARELARATRARVAVVHVMPVASLLAQAAAHGALGVERLEAVLERRGRAHVDRAAATLRQAGLDVDTFLVPGRPVRAILDVVEAVHADLVVLGSRGARPLAEAFLGSVVDGVKNHTPASVLVANAPPRPRAILVGTDGSAESRLAVATALRLAQAWVVRTVVLHVRPRHEDVPGPPGPPARALDPGLPAPGPLVAYDIEEGDPARRILEVADDRACDLVVLGARGSGALHSLVTGSVSNRVSHLAAASVLLVKTTGWARARRTADAEAGARLREAAGMAEAAEAAAAAPGAG